MSRKKQSKQRLAAIKEAARKRTVEKKAHRREVLFRNFSNLREYLEKDTWINFLVASKYMGKRKVVEMKKVLLADLPTIEECIALEQELREKAHRVKFRSFAFLRCLLIIPKYIRDNTKARPILITGSASKHAEVVSLTRKAKNACTCAR